MKQSKAVLALSILLSLFLAAEEAHFLSKARQLTFSGARSGEGYFSADGRQLVFQSEREEGNPFYQIYRMDLEIGNIERVSPGHGKTTCAWMHPDGHRVLFASTHKDPESKAHQKAELEFRASGKERRYSWDYDPHYDLFIRNMKTGELKQITDARGYDAECAFSPDGKQVVFASNRLAYSRKLSKSEQEALKQDPSIFMDIYIMNADGSSLKRLTDVLGYDGGPFFSAQGDRICWRRFSENGATAEIYTMKTDGSDVRQLTDDGHMSWAPFFHPSGEYLIYASNAEGFGNFELFLVRADGEGEPIRVTETEGFDGLAAFSPDGKRLVWTSTRHGGKKGQLYMANWNHAAALKVLTAVDPGPPVGDTAITIDDLKRHIRVLSDDRMEGRQVGTPGERRAADYIEAEMKRIGLETWREEFDFIGGIDLGPDNRLGDLKLNHDWRPLVFSSPGEIPASKLVFAGYGIVAPAQGEVDEYDSYVHLDVKDKWVVVLRFSPETVDDEARRHLLRHADLRRKAMLARDRGARGLIVVSGPGTRVKDQLVPLGFGAAMSGTSIAVVSVTDEVALKWIPDLAKRQATLDKGELMMGVQIKDVQLAGHIDLKQEARTGINLLARQSGSDPKAGAIMIGAHYDHLGKNRAGEIFNGADDNASGTAALIELAEAKIPSRYDIIFAAWSGEESGLLGSAYHARSNDLRRVKAYLNMDMIGRLDEALILQGLGSSPDWKAEIESANLPVGLNLKLSDDVYLPTDSTSFYPKGIPILSAFTGAHEDYHTPEDDFELLNFEGTQEVTRFMALLLRRLGKRDVPLKYVAVKKDKKQERRVTLRAWLGTIPDYSGKKVKGLALNGVAKEGPAEKAGLRGGDLIVELAGRKIENIYDYTYAIEGLKVGKMVKVKVIRDGKEIEMDLTPGSRD